MKKLLPLCLALFVMSCQNNNNNNNDLSLYKTNQKIAEEFILTYQSPTDFELFKSLVHDSIEHQSPMYGAGKVGYDDVMKQAEFYMTGFENVKFTVGSWLPGQDATTLLNDGSVRVYGNWSGNNIATKKPFSLDAYHYFDVKDGKIIASGDYFDATGMMVAVQPDPIQENVISSE
ncbi:nuclear transport factor 2 family protein [Bacteroidia bacterium]|nr:nuclear transport factor 2 family protein [Bacteroidia bacterium]|tara:strand:- start:2237 stop:2761 length:525 start_codon:yes stop_codon:yes gene_type:complete